MFNTLTEVPEEIQEFYYTEYQQHLTGNLVEESYEYQGDDGNIYTAIRLVPEYVTIEVVVPVPAPEFKSMGDVWRVISLHKGSRDDIIKLFLGLVDNKDQWGYLDTFLRWMKSEPSIEGPDYYYTTESGEVLLNEQLFYEAVQAWSGSKPKRPLSLDIDQWFIDNAKELRKAAYPSIEEQMRLQFEDMSNGTTEWMKAMQKVNDQYPLS